MHYLIYIKDFCNPYMYDLSLTGHNIMVMRIRIGGGGDPEACATPFHHNHPPSNSTNSL